MSCGPLPKPRKQKRKQAGAKGRDNRSWLNARRRFRKQLFRT